MRKKGSRLLEGLLFISPYLVLWLLFLFGPLLFGFFMSLHVWDPLGENKFIGLGNYLHLFRNARFWNSFLTTWKFVGMVIPGIIISALLVALLLHFVKFKGSAVFESLFSFRIYLM